MLIATHDNFPKDALSTRNFLPIEDTDMDQVFAFEDGYLVFIIFQDCFGIAGTSSIPSKVRVVAHKEVISGIDLSIPQYFPFCTIQMHGGETISDGIIDFNKTIWVTKQTAMDLSACYGDNSSIVAKEEPEILPIREPKTLIMDLEIPEEL